MRDLSNTSGPKYFHWSLETRLLLIETVTLVDEDLEFRRNTAERQRQHGYSTTTAAAAAAVSYTCTMKEKWQEVGSRLPSVFNVIDPARRGSTCHAQFMQLLRKFKQMKSDHLNNCYRNATTGQEDSSMSDELYRKLKDYQDAFQIQNEKEQPEYCPTRAPSPPSSSDYKTLSTFIRHKPEVSQELALTQGHHRLKQEQLSKRKVSMTKFFKNKNFPSTSMFRWSEAARLQVINGVRRMENNLSIAGQIKSWRTVAAMLPKELFGDISLDRLANIAKKQFSEMRRRYRLVKDNDDARALQPLKFQTLTKKVLRELKQYEDGCLRRGTRAPAGPGTGSKFGDIDGDGDFSWTIIRPLQVPSTDFAKGNYENVLVELLFSSSSDSEQDIENYSSQSVDLESDHSVDEANVGHHLEYITPIGVEKNSDDDDERELCSFDTRQSGSSAAAADNDSEDNSEDSESSYRPEVDLDSLAMERGDHHNASRQIGSSAAAAESEAELAETFTNGLKVKEEESSNDLRRLRQKLSESFSDIRRLEKELESAAAAGSDSEENFKNGARRLVSQECLDRQHKRTVPSPAAADPDSDSEPDPVSDGERNVIEASTRRQRGSLADPGRGRRRESSSVSESGHSVEENAKSRKNQQSPRRVHCHRQRRVLSAHNDPESDDPENGDHLRHLEGSLEARGYRSSADGDCQESLQRDRHLENAAASRNSEESNHENTERAACSDSESPENQKIIAGCESDSENLQHIESEELERNRNSQLVAFHRQVTARSLRLSAAAAESDSHSDENPQNGGQGNDDKIESQPLPIARNSDQAKSSDSDSANPESDNHSDSDAAPHDEFKDHVEWNNDNNPVSQHQAAESDSEEEMKNGTNNNPRGEGKVTDSTADSNKSEDEVGRSLRTAGRNHRHTDRHRSRASPGSRKRARKSGEFKHQEEIPSTKCTKAAASTDTCSDSEPDSHDHQEPEDSRLLLKTLKRLDLELTRLNWWTKYRLIPTGKEMITQVLKSGFHCNPKNLKKRQLPRSAAAGGYDEVFSKCRQKRMGLVLKAEFQQVRLKFTEEMEKTTHAVVQEVLRSFKT